MLRAIESLPAFPPNAYSGCHARAHLTYRMLDESSGGKVFKVWIFSAHTLAPALLGSIRYQGTSGQTAWGYHVAAAFLDAKFTAYVVDTLVSKSPLLLADWVQRFEIDGLAVMTFLPAPLYLFNNTEVPALDEEKFPNGLRRYIMARNVLNGNFFEYDDKSARMHDGARDLAADALSAALSKNTLPGCPWKKQAAQSLALKELATAASIPATCKKAAELFHTELARWIRAGL